MKYASVAAICGCRAANRDCFNNHQARNLRVKRSISLWEKNKLYHVGYWTSTGLATLRRDGIASMESGTGQATLITHKLQLTGSYLFINAKASKG